MEDWEDGATDLRGAGGPVKVTRQKDLTPASQAFIEALAATAGTKKIDDYNGESQEGVSVFQQNASGGLRYSSSVGYLDHHSLPNLTVTHPRPHHPGRHRPAAAPPASRSSPRRAAARSAPAAR